MSAIGVELSSSTGAADEGSSSLRWKNGRSALPSGVTRTTVNHMAAEIESIYAACERLRGENATFEARVERLNADIEEQKALNRRLLIARNGAKTKLVADKLLNDQLNANRRLSSTIDDQIEEIERLLGRVEIAL